MAFKAAKAGHIHILRWVYHQGPAEDIFHRPFLFWGAAAHGHLHALKWLAAQSLACPFDDWSEEIAAGGGHLSILEWRRQQGPLLISPTSLAEHAVAGGHLHVLQFLEDLQPGVHTDATVARIETERQHMHVLEWILAQGTRSDLMEPIIGIIVKKAVTHGLIKPLEMLHQRGLLSRVPRPLLDVLAERADLPILQLLSPIMAAQGDIFHVLLRCLDCSTARGRYRLRYKEEDRSTTPQQDLHHCQAAAWLVSLFDSFTSSQQDQLHQAAAWAHSIVPVQLASQGVRPVIKWGSAMHAQAAAEGDVHLLKWMLTHCDDDAFGDTHLVKYALTQRPATCWWTRVDNRCRSSRVLLLVHGYGWWVPSGLETYLRAREGQRLALYIVVQQQRRRPSPRSCLGDLPDILVKKIACCADVDFSWTFSI
ncbi:hypothetical protein WJX84_005316 [Apatococcus fuscideae]|uniref:Uncharacterized protein n=1 Tax=Apatococcus fuscideae TaxID=2026836 RepID=A0AAW1T9L5_9CHLO